MSRLFAVMLLKCAETAVYVQSPCLGGFLNIDLTVRYFKPKEYCFHVPGITSSVFAAPCSKVFLWNTMSWSAPW